MDRPLLYGKLPQLGMLDKETGSFDTVSKEGVLQYYAGKAAADDKRTKTELDMGDISDLVSPGVTNMVQMNMVKTLFGNDTAKTLMFLKAALHGGLLSNSCPSADRPDLTEPAIDVKTGKIFCRAPKELYRDRAQPANAACDLFNLETYVDALGRTICRRPVLSGHFSCPPPDRPDDKMHITTEDGEGLCVNPLTYSDLNMGLNYAVFPFNTNTEIARYVSLIGKSIKFQGVKDIDEAYRAEKRREIARLNNHLLTHLTSPKTQSVGNMVKLVAGDPETMKYVEIIRNLQSTRDVMNLNGALFIINRNQLGTDYSLDDWYKWFGLSKEDLVKE